MASLQGKIAIAERQLKAARGEPVELGRYPLSTEQLALRNYEERLAQDEKTRNTMLGWADVSVDDLFVAELRAGIAGKLTDAALQELVGPRIERYKLPDAIHFVDTLPVGRTGKADRGAARLALQRERP